MFGRSGTPSAALVNCLLHRAVKMALVLLDLIAPEEGRSEAATVYQWHGTSTGLGSSLSWWPIWVLTVSVRFLTCVLINTLKCFSFSARVDRLRGWRVESSGQENRGLWQFPFQLSFGYIQLGPPVPWTAAYMLERGAPLCTINYYIAFKLSCLFFSRYIDFDIHPYILCEYVWLHCKLPKIYCI